MPSPRTVFNIMFGPAAKIANECGVIIADMLIPPIRYTELADLLDAKKITMQGVEEILWSLYYQEFYLEVEALNQWLRGGDHSWLAFQNICFAVEDAAETGTSMAEYLGVLIAGTDDEIDVVIDTVLNTKPKALDDYRKGKVSALGAIMGMIMKGQKFNPTIVKERLLKKMV